MSPLVSVICLCYNHDRYVREAVQSVLDQTYHPIQLIVVDDCSTDNSAAVIEEMVKRHPEIHFIRHQTNVGNCRSFNEGLAITKGSYVIDLAADDALLPSRVEQGVRALEGRLEYGVQFSDAEIIDEDGRKLGLHSDRFPHETIPSGFIFLQILSRYFINSPTMMMRKSLLDELGGYDESLAYEDFDFWVRSSRNTQYLYIPEVLMKRRQLKSSMGKKQFDVDNPQLRSTLVVCEKAFRLSRNKEEFNALKERVMYEFRKSTMAGAFGIGWRYWKLWMKLP